MSTLQDGGWTIINSINAKYCRIRLTLLAGWSPRFWIYSDMDNKPFPDLSSPLWWGPEQHFEFLFYFSVQKPWLYGKESRKVVKRTHTIHSSARWVLLGVFVVLELPRGIFVRVFFLVRVFLVGVFFFLLGGFFFSSTGRFMEDSLWTGTDWCRAGASLRFLSKYSVR